MENYFDYCEFVTHHMEEISTMKMNWDCLDDEMKKVIEDVEFVLFTLE